eukprot:NODE_240_length_13260_cov_0.403313.p5 type:complete len:120 gc:universal NODE_240_length_13260_cov_0.403313:4178-3819(-)
MYPIATSLPVALMPWTFKLAKLGRLTLTKLNSAIKLYADTMRIEGLMVIVESEMLIDMLEQVAFSRLVDIAILFLALNEIDGAVSNCNNSSDIPIRVLNKVLYKRLNTDKSSKKCKSEM